jgi:hypothetical protein
MQARRRLEFTGVELTGGAERLARGVIAIERGSQSGATLHFFELGDGASRRRWTSQGTPQPWSGPGRG